MQTNQRWYLSTIDGNAPRLARQYGLGLEIAEFCTASNLDDHRAQTDEALTLSLSGISRRVLHGPFNELFPCAIDPKARALAAQRYLQAAAAAVRYGAPKLVIHGGYQPFVYYSCWYVEQSVLFWRELLPKLPDGISVVLENVLEPNPDDLFSIVQQVDDLRLALCLDVGHANACSKTPVDIWLETWASRLSHFHIHNNTGEWDTHSPLTEGSIPMAEFLPRAISLCPQASFTLEIPQAESSLVWMAEQGLLETPKGV